MPLSIDGNKLSAVTVPGHNQKTLDKAQRDQPADPAQLNRAANTGDNVSLTRATSLIREISAELNNQPVTDSARIDAIRKSIEAGTYQVDAGRVADKLLALESGLAPVKNRV
jgi:flagellar biosynthesis anti-sigma factor FlgM